MGGSVWKGGKNMKISWVILTYNRLEPVKRAFVHNVENAGAPIDELIWVDNGSNDGTKEFALEQHPDVMVANKVNLGVAKGYNRAFVLATGDYIVITGCDMLMPKDWMKTLKTYLEKIPNTGVACMYSVQLDEVKERLKGEREIVEGLPIVPALPIGRRVFSRQVLEETGYLREDFGLYGWEDVEWATRCWNACKRIGVRSYVIPDMVAEHLGTEGIKMTDGKDPIDYHKFKQDEVKDPKKMELLRWCETNNYPYYNPYV